MGPCCKHKKQGSRGVSGSLKLCCHSDPLNSTGTSQSMTSVRVGDTVACLHGVSHTSSFCLSPACLFPREEVRLFILDFGYVLGLLVMKCFSPFPFHSPLFLLDFKYKCINKFSAGLICRIGSS